MGTTTVAVTIGENMQYSGAVEEGQPHGRGTITYSPQAITRSGSSTTEGSSKSWLMEGEFNKGDLTACTVRRSRIAYSGGVREYRFQGRGELNNAALGVNIAGEFTGSECHRALASRDRTARWKGTLRLSVSKPSDLEDENNKLYVLEGADCEYRLLDTGAYLKGTFVNGQLTGTGEAQLINQDLYRGEFSNGYFEGQGDYISSSGKDKSETGITKISGNFNKSKLNAQNASIQFSNGDVYEGPMKNGYMHGSNGKYTYKNGTVYRGTFHHNEMLGECEICYPADNPVEKYQGETSEGALHGLGIVQYRNGAILKGNFYKNAKNGPCLFIYGQRMFKCLYLMDELKGGFTEIFGR